MTSPRQRKKRLAVLRFKEEQAKAQEVQIQVEKVLEKVPTPVLESGLVLKSKKTKTALVELVSQDQVVEQSKEEVKTPTKE